MYSLTRIHSYVLTHTYSLTHSYVLTHSLSFNGCHGSLRGLTQSLNASEGLVELVGFPETNSAKQEKKTKKQENAAISASSIDSCSPSDCQTRFCL